MFHSLCKYLEFRQKYSAARRIFNSLFDVWITRWNNVSYVSFITWKTVDQTKINTKQTCRHVLIAKYPRKWLDIIYTPFFSKKVILWNKFSVYTQANVLTPGTVWLVVYSSLPFYRLKRFNGRFFSNNRFQAMVDIRQKSSFIYIFS